MNSVKEKNPNEKVEFLNQIKELSAEIEKYPANAELLHSRAAIFIKIQEWAKAINDYQKILAIDKNDKIASGQIDMLTTILRIGSNDIYANPNTELDPWFE